MMALRKGLILRSPRSELSHQGDGITKAAKSI